MQLVQPQMDYSLHDCELSDECEPLFPIQYADKEPPIHAKYHTYSNEMHSRGHARG